MRNAGIVGGADGACAKEQRCRNAEVQMCRGTKVQRNKGAEGAGAVQR